MPLTPSVPLSFRRFPHHLPQPRYDLVNIWRKRSRLCHPGVPEPTKSAEGDTRSPINAREESCGQPQELGVPLSTSQHCICIFVVLQLPASDRDGPGGSERTCERTGCPQGVLAQGARGCSVCTSVFGCGQVNAAPADHAHSSFLLSRGWSFHLALGH